MWNLLLASWLSVSAVDVKVTPLAGDAQTGAVVRLVNDELVVKTGAGEQTFDLKNVASVVRTDSPATAAAATDVQVLLMDGSALVAESITARQGKATLRLAGGVELETRTRAIRAVRLKRPLEAIDATWQEILDKKATGDQIVVRKTSRAAEGDDKSAVVLDRLEGIVQEVTAETVKFEFEGDVIDVRREKLEGIIFFSPVARELPSSLCRLSDRHGSLWNVRTLRLEGENLLVETTAGLSATIRLASLDKLDFSVGNTTYLNELEPDADTAISFFGSPSNPAHEKNWLQFRRAQGGGRAVLGGQSYEKAVKILSRTQVVYRLPKDAKRLLATVGIDDRVDGNGSVRLTISGDTQVLFDQTITGKDKPLPLALDVAGARRLTILVDFGGEIDIGDHLTLANARITK